MTNDAIYVDLDNERILRGNQFADKTSSSPVFANELSALSGEKIAIVKSSQSATSLGSDTNPTWNPQVSNSLTDKAIADYKKSIEILEAEGFDVVPVGFVWTQGESDAVYYEDTYAANFRAMIEKMRSELGDDLTVFINLVGDRDKDDNAQVVWRSLEAIRASQRQVADELDNVYVVSDIAPRFASVDLDMMQDLWHYTDDAYILLGQQSAKYVYHYYFEKDPESFDLNEYKDNKLVITNNYKDLVTDSDILAYIDDVNQKIRNATSTGEVDEYVSDLEFKIGADIVKQNYTSIINSYADPEDAAVQAIINDYQNQLGSKKTVYEIEELANATLEKLTLSAKKQELIDEMKEYLKQYPEDSVAAIYDEFVSRVNNATSIKEIYSIVDDTLVALEDIPKIVPDEDGDSDSSDVDNSTIKNNPATLDNISKYITLFIVSVIMLFVVSVGYIKVSKKRKIKCN